MDAMRELTWRDGQILWGDKQIGSFATMTFRERAIVRFETEQWEYAKEFGGTVVGARTDGEPQRMSADKGGLFFPSWDVRTPFATYRLKRSQVLTAGSAVGWYEHRGVFSVRVSVAVPDTVPMCDHVFLLWIAYVDEKRRGSAG